jgi:eight-cysteine-cluster-containing protein
MNKQIYLAVVIIVILVLVLIILTMNTGEAPECVNPLDCKGPHDECEGEWRCAHGRCVWDCAITPPGECSSDSDCTTGGCSGEICISKSEEPPITTCEWREEYGCLELNNCKCIGGKCKWEDTEDYLSCLEDVKKAPPLMPV